MAQPPPAAARKGYGAGARILSIGIATTGVVTFAYFSLASHALSDADYSHISLLWAVLFVIVSVLYRPIEQLLSRTIAGRRARGLQHGHPLRTPLIIQATFAVTFVIVALALKGPITDGLFDGSDALFWVLFFAVLFYAASYFARGWLAGHQWFGALRRPRVHGGDVALPVRARRRARDRRRPDRRRARHGRGAARLARGRAAGVLAPAAGRGRAARRRGGPGPARGGRFALAVFCVMLAEQTLINGAVLTAYATAASAAVAGYVFNVLLIARAPLQLFQAIQGSLLPHLAGLHATEDSAEFHRAIRVTVLAIAGFAGAVALGLLLLGPWVMNVLFDDAADYGRWGLAIVALGMGAHLAAGTLNQAALARDHAHLAALAWIVSAALFVGWMLAPIIDDELVRTEVGYLGAATLLCGLLTLVYRRPPG